MILYKKDSKGKLRSLEIYAEGNKVIQIAGLLDGKKVRQESTCVPKNVGRASETTAEEQAMKEAEAKIKKKLEKEYFKTQEEAEGSSVLLPMLAKELGKEFHKIDWQNDVFMQPKLDGMRCLMIVKRGTIKLLSRQGKDLGSLGTMNHIMEAAIKFLGKERYLTSDIVFDGEIFMKDTSFQEIMKRAKKYRPGESEKLEYHIYDTIAPSLGGYRTRLEYLTLVLTGLSKESPLKLINTIWPIKSQKDIDIFHTKFLKEGYEGSIIRHGNKPYKVKGRCDSLLKYKDFIDGDYEIIDVIPFEKWPTQGKFKCKTADGKEFETGMKMSHTEREEVLANKRQYIGKLANIRYFELTDDGLPRFPQCIGARLDDPRETVQVNGLCEDRAHKEAFE